MSDELVRAVNAVGNRQARATLAAAIIQSRHAVTIENIQKACEDAHFILYPNSPGYAGWAQRNGTSAPGWQIPML